jgi:hypothetical protein
MAMTSDTSASLASPSPGVNSALDATRQTLRRVGYGLLFAGVLVQIASEQIALVRGVVRRQLSRAVDDALPPENRILDVALEILAYSEASEASG